jgi:hypothetical protein
MNLTLATQTTFLPLKPEPTDVILLAGVDPEYENMSWIPILATLTSLLYAIGILTLTDQQSSCVSLLTFTLFCPTNMLSLYFPYYSLFLFVWMPQIYMLSLYLLSTVSSDI